VWPNAVAGSPVPGRDLPRTCGAKLSTLRLDPTESHGCNEVDCREWGFPTGKTSNGLILIVKSHEFVV
jgi:hypothetical protein